MIASAPRFPYIPTYSILVLLAISVRPPVRVVPPPLAAAAGAPALIEAPCSPVASARQRCWCPRRLNRVPQVPQLHGPDHRGVCGGGCQVQYHVGMGTENVSELHNMAYMRSKVSDM
jgi:hypothetical protein